MKTLKKQPQIHKISRRERTVIAAHATVDERSVKAYLEGRGSEISAYRISNALKALDLVHLISPGFKA